MWIKTMVSLHLSPLPRRYQDLKPGSCSGNTALPDRETGDREDLSCKEEPYPGIFSILVVKPSKKLYGKVPREISLEEVLRLLCDAAVVLKEPDLEIC
jgi:hypothetical protein